MTTIEKAAKASYMRIWGGEPMTEWEDISLRDQDRHRLAARAVLTAIREPDEATAEALENVNGVFGLVAWQAAIDAILAGKP